MATPIRPARSVPQRLLGTIAAAVLVALTVLVGTPLHATAPSAQAANGAKAIVIVGPSGESTSLFLDIGDRVADEAAAAGMDVRRIFHPNATTERVQENIQGANLVVYLGHGNGWPSPYGPFQEKTKNGFGLNEVAGGSQNKHVYRGANWIRKNVTLAPNAVTILIGACYASGNGEPGTPVPSQDIAKQRVDNFAAGFLAVGAGAVFAFGWEQRANYPALLMTSDKTMDEIFMTRSNGSPSGWVGWNDKYLSSERTPGARVHLDPHSSYGYYRALTGDLSMTAAQFRGSQSSGTSDGSAPSAPRADMTPPTVPTGLSGVNRTGREVTLTWQASSDDSTTDLKYRIYRNGKRVATRAGTSYVETVRADGAFRYRVQAVDAAGNPSARSAEVVVDVGGASTSGLSGAPPTPQGLTAETLGFRRVQLTWQASTSSRGPVIYRVFRNGKRIATVETLGYVDRPASAGTYAYKVRAIDGAWRKSSFSREVIGRAARGAT